MRRPQPGPVPPRLQASPSPQITPPQLWVTLPTEHRRKTLQTLSRLVAQQLHAPRSPREGSHEAAEPPATQSHT